MSDSKQFKELVKKSKEKVTPEKDIRNLYLSLAQEYGFEEDLKKINDRYDSILKRCKSDDEREQVAIMGLVEVHRLLCFKGPLIVNGKEIIPAHPDWVPQN